MQIINDVAICMWNLTPAKLSVLGHNQYKGIPMTMNIRFENGLDLRMEAVRKIEILFSSIRFQTVNCRTWSTI